VTTVEIAAMLAFEPQWTNSPIDVTTLTGLLVLAAASFACLAFFLRDSERHHGAASRCDRPGGQPMPGVTVSSRRRF
jgi:hypothetical protein